MQTLKPIYFYVIGLILLGYASYSNLTTIDCDTDLTWTSYITIAGVLVIGNGLLIKFHRQGASYLRAVILSLLIAFFILILVTLFVLKFQPGGLLRCWQF